MPRWSRISASINGAATASSDGAARTASTGSISRSSSAPPAILEHGLDLIDRGRGDDLVVVAAGAGRLLEQGLYLGLLSRRHLLLVHLVLHLGEIPAARGILGTGHSREQRCQEQDR